MRLLNKANLSGKDNYKIGLQMINRYVIGKLESEGVIVPNDLYFDEKLSLGHTVLES